MNKIVTVPEAPLLAILHEFREEQQDVQGHEITVAFSPYYNLMGAIYSLRQSDRIADDASLRTLDRIETALGNIETAVEELRKALGAPDSPVDGG